MKNTQLHRYGKKVIDPSEGVTAYKKNKIKEANIDLYNNKYSNNTTSHKISQREYLAIVEQMKAIEEKQKQRANTAPDFTNILKGTRRARADPIDKTTNDYKYQQYAKDNNIVLNNKTVKNVKNAVDKLRKTRAATKKSDYTKNLGATRGVRTNDLSRITQLLEDNYDTLGVVNLQKFTPAELTRIIDNVAKFETHNLYRVTVLYEFKPEDGGEDRLGTTKTRWQSVEQFFVPKDMDTGIENVKLQFAVQKELDREDGFIDSGGKVELIEVLNIHPINKININALLIGQEVLKQEFLNYYVPSEDGKCLVTILWDKCKFRSPFKTMSKPEFFNDFNKVVGKDCNYSIGDLDVWTDRYPSVTAYVVGPDKKVLVRYNKHDKSQKTDNVICIYVNNNHVDLITDVDVIQQILYGNGDIRTLAGKDRMIEIQDLNPKTLDLSSEDVYGFSEKEMMDYYTKGYRRIIIKNPLEPIVAAIHETTGTQINSLDFDSRMEVSLMVYPNKECPMLIERLDSFSLCPLSYTKKIRTKFPFEQFRDDHMTYSSVARKLCDCMVGEIPVSYYNEGTRNIFDNNFVGPITGVVKTPDQEYNEDDEEMPVPECYEIDLKRCYRNILHSNTNNFPVYTNLDSFQPYTYNPTDDIVCGEYFVAEQFTINHIPFKPGVYNYIFIEYVLKTLKLDLAITARIQAYSFLKGDTFKLMLDYIKYELGDNKNMPNCFIGTLHKKYTATNNSYTSTDSNLVDFLEYRDLMEKNMFSKVKKVGDLYFVKSTSRSRKVSDNCSIFRQIIHSNFINLIQIANVCPEEVVAVRTDAIYFEECSKKLERFASRNSDRLRLNKDKPMDLKRLLCTDYPRRDIECTLSQWNIVTELPGNNENCMVLGGAGCGKTTLLTKVYGETENCCVVSSTNYVVQNLKKLGCDNSYTLESFFKSNVAHYETILLDEISSVSVIAMCRLMNMNKRMIMFGDMNQLPPVSVQTYDYENNNVMKQEMKNLIKLSYIENANRYTPSTLEVMNKITASETITLSDITGFNTTAKAKCKKNIVYTNSLRHSINNSFTGSIVGEEYIGKVNRGKKEIWNSKIYTVTGVQDDRVELDHNVLVTEAEFAEFFDKAYAITAHKVQGSTIEGDYNVHVELRNKKPYFTKNALYVALSRCRDISQVNIVDYENVKDIVFEPYNYEGMVELKPRRIRVALIYEMNDEDEISCYVGSTKYVSNENDMYGDTTSTIDLKKYLGKCVSLDDTCQEDLLKLEKRLQFHKTGRQSKLKKFENCHSIHYLSRVYYFSAAMVENVFEKKYIKIMKDLNDLECVNVRMAIKAKKFKAPIIEYEAVDEVAELLNKINISDNKNKCMLRCKSKHVTRVLEVLYKKCGIEEGRERMIQKIRDNLKT